MELPGAGKQQPGVAAAPSREIDLSLDDIIRRNQEAQPQRKPWRRQLKAWNAASGNGRPGFQSWGPPALPGSSRFPGGFRKPLWSRAPFWRRMSTPGPRAAGQMQGRSPLNRPAFAQQDRSGEGPPGRNSRGAPPEDAQPGAPARAKAFGTAGAPRPFRRPFRLNRGRAFLQGQIKLSFNRRQVKSKMERNRPRTRRPGPKRPFPRRRNSQTPPSRRQPRGVMLRFNFRAMANQNSVTLNERFSGLWHKRHFAAERNASRMVTLP